MNTPQLAFTIPEFCEAHRISRAGYYNLELDRRPRETRLGAKVIISVEDAADWRRRMAERTVKESADGGTT